MTPWVLMIVCLILLLFVVIVRIHTAYHMITPYSGCGAVVYRE